MLPSQTASYLRSAGTWRRGNSEMRRLFSGARLSPARLESNSRSVDRGGRPADARSTEVRDRGGRAPPPPSGGASSPQIKPSEGVTLLDHQGGHVR